MVSRLPQRLVLLLTLACCHAVHSAILDISAPVVEVEESVYSFIPARNGADPLWDFGSTNLARVGERVFASGLETLTGVAPLSNTRCNLWERGGNGWMLVRRDASGRTREPCPLAVLPNQEKVFLSANPSLGPRDRTGGSRAKPVLLRFSAQDARRSPIAMEPVWQHAPERPQFNEHSYRTFVADGEREELLLFQNVGDSHAQWTLRDRHDHWVAGGQLKWPSTAEYKRPKPLRICYPNVALRNRAVHFVGVSDVVEPNQRWHRAKHSLTHRSWDYVFRRLLYVWSPDIARAGFKNWVEIANREKTAGRIIPGDLWLAPDGAAHIVWTETAVDTSLRDRFFPQEMQRYELNYAVIRAGKIELRQTLLSAGEGQAGAIPHLPRFQITPELQAFVFFYVDGTDENGAALAENRMVEIGADGSLGPMVRVPLGHPLNNYMTATVRAGSTPSYTLDLLGTSADTPDIIRYARVRLQ